MCIIIDTNTWASIFNVEAEDHLEFKPVYDWLVNGEGKVVYGGTTYFNEIPRKYRKIIKLLKDRAKIIELSKEEVDTKEEELKKIISHRDFDDPHIVAIVIISKCKLICTNELRAIPFFKDTFDRKRLFYPKGFIRPKIYSSSANRDLLSDTRNIASLCKVKDKKRKKRS